MGTWGTAVKDSDTFADIYSEFFNLYNKGGQPESISRTIIADNWEILEIEGEKNSLWFALSLAQWETKSLDPKVLLTVEDIIASGTDLKTWRDLGASEADISKRKIALDKFLERIKSEKTKAKPRKIAKVKKPIFEIGDCLVFKFANGNYGGVVVLGTDNNSDTAYNLIATTRLSQRNKPTLNDFENAEVLICNYGEWKDHVDVSWILPDLFYKVYANIYENIGKISVDLEYDAKNYDGKGYLFQPYFTANWGMNNTIQKQFDSELTKPRSTKTITVRQLTKKEKWWKVFG